MEKRPSRLQQLREMVEAVLSGRALWSNERLPRWHRVVHFWVLVGQSFSRNRCPVRAAALAYATLLALIPMLAVVISVTSTFLKSEGEDRIDAFIMKLVSTVATPGADTNAVVTVTNTSAAFPSEEPANAAVEPGSVTNRLARAALKDTAAKGPLTNEARESVTRYIHKFIRNTRSGALGITGSVLLIFAAISMLSRIEDTFNDIWGVARGRSWFMRIVLYWGVLSLAPLLLAVALGLATGPYFEATRRSVTQMPFIGHFVVEFGLLLLPVLVLCLTFALFYMLMPNTRVHWQAALAGGLAGGLLFHANNAVSVLYVSRVVSNSKIYGSLGLVPVFMIGTYLSWLILLFGAQVAYAWQNRAAYRDEKLAEHVNQRGREFVALRLMTCIGARFGRGEPPPSVAEISDQLSVPSRLVRQLLQTLAAAQLVAETTGAEPSYLPARPLETITCHDVLLAMRASQGQELATREEPARAEVYGEFQRIQEAERQAASSVTLLALVNRTGKQLTE